MSESLDTIIRRSREENERAGAQAAFDFLVQEIERLSWVHRIRTADTTRESAHRYLLDLTAITQELTRLKAALPRAGEG